jgi:hypothetical protein
MTPKTKRRATLMAAMEREVARPIGRLRSYRDELAAAGMAVQEAGGEFPSGLSLALDRAQLALEALEECTSQEPEAAA